MTRDFSWLFVLAAILLVRWIAFEAFAERAIRKGDEVLFRPPFGLRLLFGVALPGFTYAAGAVGVVTKLQRALVVVGDVYRLRGLDRLRVAS